MAANAMTAAGRSFQCVISALLPNSPAAFARVARRGVHQTATSQSTRNADMQTKQRT